MQLQSVHTATRKFVAAPPATHIDSCDDNCGDDDGEGTDADANNGNDLSIFWPGSIEKSGEAEPGGRGVAMDKIADRELGGQDHARHAAVGFCVQRDHAPFPHIRPLVGT